ncbi:HAMP domain-containing sensor histidine kinase [Streptococcus plurextorum]|uniref:HAMP domain-containing sensor histidine kinase n=1 Tax=Streptococcus plurextorum TaxID=456876 RepID=UPI000487DE73|nr:HAMP domain-containing histidine kinase [Streptococcus plurextorum]
MFIFKRLSLAKRVIFTFSLLFFLAFLGILCLSYTLTTDQLLRTEENKVEQAITNVTERLSVGEEAYSLESLTEVLYQNAMTDDILEGTDGLYLLRTERDVTNMLYSNQDLYIYDLEGNVLFTTDAHSEGGGLSKEFLSRSYQKDGEQGLVYEQVILSKQTGETLGYVKVFHDLTYFYTVRNRLFFIVLGGQLIFTILVACALIRIVRHFLSPISTLHRAMTEIADRPEDLTLRTNISTGGEIGELSVIFDSMLDKLEEHGRLQSQFISDVSHELRTPVAVIQGHLGLLQRWGKNDPEILDESLKASYDEAHRMSVMINDMLDMVRVKGSFEEHLKDTANVVKSAQTVISNFKVLRPDFTFKEDYEQEGLIAQFYANHLEQAMTIILDNAVKYSQEHKEIHLSVTQGQEAIILKIQDSGEGIGEEDLKHIFERFYRTDKSRNRVSTKAGLGIGLSILKQIVDAYSCRMTVESEVGKGTTFILYLPIAKG